MKKADYRDLIRYIQSLYEKAGVTEEQARMQAENMTLCEAKGVWSHGVGMAKRHLEDVVAGKINLNPAFRIVKETPAIAKVDGDNGLGTAAAVYATRCAIRKAKEAGCACVGVTGANHFGAGHYFAEMAAAEHVILYIYTTGDATMAPYGGIRRYYGTNPYTYAAPAGKYPPYILDMATTMGAARKVQQCVTDGTPAPAGWGIDREGSETTDAAEILGPGAMLPVGGAKGSGLAGMVAVMGGVLNGAAYRDDVCCMPIGGRQVNNGYFIMAVDIVAFMEPEEFDRRMEALAEDVCAIPPRPGFESVSYPGYASGEKLRRAKEEGVVLGDIAWQALNDMAEMVGAEGPETVFP